MNRATDPDVSNRHRKGASQVYAIINDNGRQHKVSEGDAIAIDRIDLEPGATVEFTDVLLFRDGDALTVGAPSVAGVKVVGEVKGLVLDRKVFATMYRRRKNSRRKVGARPKYTEVVIKSIVAAKA